ncbi:DUF5668 domain-containing protein [Cytobacillus sp. S13-E01]|uniref:LiaI-LiaF-like domain-containing protein n=1 Tax=Cytobacillus sp. S13-E01 TaxID=3031326 RepID=UPI0023D84A85|nr:DUF5668 domain-containing protein [Cytobacillus sp. S13-E01]MDF0726737.1 DUF5668 domain-containing protein [Cytobacillus sp. S13-E01]
MKKQSIFPGIILIGMGSYFLLQQLNITIINGFFTWQTLVIIIGIALLVQAYSGNDHSIILPGVILVGFGIHFHSANLLSFWPKHYGMLILIIAIGFLLRYVKTKSGLFQGLLLLAMSFLILYYDKFIQSLGFLESDFSFVIKFWPVILIASGFYLLFIKKK